MKVEERVNDIEELNECGHRIEYAKIRWLISVIRSRETALAEITKLDDCYECDASGVAKIELNKEIP